MDDTKRSTPLNARSQIRGGVHEKVIHTDRPHSGVVGNDVFVDDKEAITEELVELVGMKVFCLYSQYKEKSNESATRAFLREEQFNGQMGFIRGQQLPSSPDPQRQRESQAAAAPARYRRFEATPYTAKHNVMNRTVEGIDYIYQGASLISPFIARGSLVFSLDNRDPPTGDDEVLVRAGSDDGTEMITWGYHEVISGKPIGEAEAEKLHELTRSTHSFEKAVDFTIKPGQKIGIAVYRTWEIRREDAGVNTGTEETWKQKRHGVFGEMFTPCVYTGEVVRVSDDGSTFEHTINTFLGCSGAIIFLLDKNQPADIARATSSGGNLHGKAIGLHAGSPEPYDVKTNVGFKL